VLLRALIRRAQAFGRDEWYDVEAREPKFISDAWLEQRIRRLADPEKPDDPIRRFSVADNAKVRPPPPLPSRRRPPSFVARPPPIPSAHPPPSTS